jgi:hypothetical protein
MWSEIITQLKSLLESTSVLQAVYIYEVEEFNEDPVATITPSDNSSDFNTTAENERVYAFTIRVFVNRTVLKSGIDTKSDADRILRNIVDKIINVLDKNFDLPNITNPVGYTFINLFATPSSWGYAGGRESEFRAAEINVRARVVVETELLT